MLVKPSLRRGSIGDALLRTRGGGDAHPRAGTQEPCIYFLKRGRCFRGDRCHFRHIQTPNVSNAVPVDNRSRQGKRKDNTGRHKESQAIKTCFYCGKPGHIKKDCRKRVRDTAKAATDFVCPAVEFPARAGHSIGDVGLQPQVNCGVGDAIYKVDGDPDVKWLVDGGASCHVVGFDPGSFLDNRKHWGGIACTCTGDLTILVRQPQAPSSSRITLQAVRVVPGFGSNLLSGPRMVKAGWSLTQQDGVFTARGSQRHVVFSLPADSKGLYFLSGVVISRSPALTPRRLRGQRNGQLQHGSLLKSGVSHFFRPDNGKEQVNRLNTEIACRLDQSEEFRSTTPLFLPSHTRDFGRESSASFALSSIHSPSIHSPSSSVSPLSVDPGGAVTMANGGIVASPAIFRGEATGVLGTTSVSPHWLPSCYFREPCSFCEQPVVETVAPAIAVSARETKQLMDAHLRFGHRNFKSLAKALNLRMPAKVPFCRACVEAKSTRHPKSSVPRPLRELAPRPGYRIHFDPFGPFPERLADGSYYGLLFADAYSTVDTIPTLKDWFAHLKTVVLQVESDKGSDRAVAQLATDSAPMFKSNREYRKYADSKGIVLLFSAPYTQKFNAPVERPIRTLMEMALAMARHANTPRRFMNLAMKFAVMNRLSGRCLMDPPMFHYGATKGLRSL